MTWLDRTKLADYVGTDAAFEREFLTVLRPSVGQCLEALASPGACAYGVLHGAKPGLLVATSDAFGAAYSALCRQLLVDASGPTTRAQMALLKARLLELHAELDAYFIGLE